MRLWILSDLHLEYAALKAPLEPPQADVCVIAGDHCRNPAAGVKAAVRSVFIFTVPSFRILVSMGQSRRHFCLEAFGLIRYIDIYCDNFGRGPKTFRQMIWIPFACWRISVVMVGTSAEWMRIRSSLDRSWPIVMR